MASPGPRVHSHMCWPSTAPAPALLRGDGPVCCDRNHASDDMRGFTPSAVSNRNETSAAKRWGHESPCQCSSRVVALVVVPCHGHRAAVRHNRLVLIIINCASSTRERVPCSAVFLPFDFRTTRSNTRLIVLSQVRSDPSLLLAAWWPSLTVAHCTVVVWGVGQRVTRSPPCACGPSIAVMADNVDEGSVYGLSARPLLVVVWCWA